MKIVRFTLEDGKELTPDEHALVASRLEKALKRPYTYYPDCPLLTLEQLAEFCPVNFATMEERAEAMREADIFDPEEAVGRETFLETVYFK